MKRQSRKSILAMVAIISLALVFIFSACPAEEGTTTPTAPASPGEPTLTPAPTSPGEATSTPAPTSPGEPTSTPAPTSPGEATSTPAPTSPGEATPAPTPGADVPAVTSISAELIVREATPSPTASPASSPTPEPTASPTIPPANQTGSVVDVTINVEVENFNVVDNMDQPNAEGEGHIIYYLNAVPPTTQGQPATTEPDTFIAAADTTYTWMEAPAGDHVFSVQLVNNDGTPLELPVIASVQVTVPEADAQDMPMIQSLMVQIMPAATPVAQETPGATPTETPSPAAAQTAQETTPDATPAETPAATPAPEGNADVTITIEVVNFEIVDNIGEANVEGEGHVLFYINEIPSTEAGQPAVPEPGTVEEVAENTYTWANVPAGTHVFSVQLVNNDQTPLQPPIVAVAAVTVQEGAAPVPSTPVITPEATPGATPEATPAATPEATPEATPAATPEATPEATPAATPELTPAATP